MKATFTRIYRENLWRSAESVSGTGSTLDETEEIRRFLPKFLTDFKIQSMLDIPCGDMNWLSLVDLGGVAYIGADIVSAIVARNQQDHDERGVRFTTLDITTDDLPKVDVMLVRDCLGHFSNADVQKAIRNIKRARPTYLLSTTFPQEENVGDIETGQWRPINLARMFGLPEPQELWPEINVQFDGHISVKCLGLWRIDGK